MRPVPRHGLPCNGCGVCCQREVCPLGSRVFGRTRGPCPGLEHDGDGFACGLMRHPANYSPARTYTVGAERMREAAAWLIGAGAGCDFLSSDRPVDQAFRDRLALIARGGREETKRALAAWGFRK